jgi:hypothetical protein
MRMRYTSNRNHIQEVYKKYLLRTFDGFLIRGSRYDKNKTNNICKTPFPLPLHMRMQYTSNRNHIQEVYKRYLLRTFDGFLIRGSHSDKNKKIISVRPPFPLPLRMRMRYTSNRNHIQEVNKRYLLRTFDKML